MVGDLICYGVVLGGTGILPVLDVLGGTSLSAAKGVVHNQATPFAALRDVPPSPSLYPTRPLYSTTS